MPDEQVKIEKSSVYTESDKLHWEVDKLRAEVTGIQRSYLKSPGSWIPMVTAIVAIIGVGVQYFKSDREYQLADIKRQQALLDIQRLEDTKRDTNKVIADARATLAELDSQRQQSEAKLKATTDALFAAEKRLSDLTLTTDIKGELDRVIGEVKTSIADLNNVNTQAAANSEEATRSLEILGTELKGFGYSDLKLRDYKIGIYYRVDKPDAKKLAEQVKTSIWKDQLVGSVELYPRNLSFFESVVPPETHEVRYELAREDEPAKQLVTALNQRNPSLQFQLRPVGGRTPRFISVFIWTDKD